MHTQHHGETPVFLRLQRTSLFLNQRTWYMLLFLFWLQCSILNRLQWLQLFETDTIRLSPRFYLPTLTNMVYKSLQLVYISMRSLSASVAWGGMKEKVKGPKYVAAWKWMLNKPIFMSKINSPPSWWSTLFSNVETTILLTNDCDEELVSLL